MAEKTYRKCGDNTYIDDEFQLYHLIDGEYKPFSLLVEAYESRYRMAKVMSRVGVSFTPEQEAQVKAHVAAGETAKAQRVILELLKEEFKDSE